MLDIARDACAVAKEGLKARGRTDGFDGDERGFLAAVESTLEEGRTPAEEMLENYHGKWQGNLDNLFAEYSY